MALKIMERVQERRRKNQLEQEKNASLQKVKELVDRFNLQDTPTQELLERIVLCEYQVEKSGKSDFAIRKLVHELETIDVWEKQVRAMLSEPEDNWSKEELENMKKFLRALPDIRNTFSPLFFVYVPPKPEPEFSDSLDPQPPYLDGRAPEPPRLDQEIGRTPDAGANMGMAEEALKAAGLPLHREVTLPLPMGGRRVPMRVLVDGLTQNGGDWKVSLRVLDAPAMFEDLVGADNTFSLDLGDLKEGNFSSMRDKAEEAARGILDEVQEMATTGVRTTVEGLANMAAEKFKNLQLERLMNARTFVSQEMRRAAAEAGNLADAIQKLSADGNLSPENKKLLDNLNAAGSNAVRALTLAIERAQKQLRGEDVEAGGASADAVQLLQAVDALRHNSYLEGKAGEMTRAKAELEEAKANLENPSLKPYDAENAVSTFFEATLREIIATKKGYEFNDEIDHALGDIEKSMQEKMRNLINKTLAHMDAKENYGGIKNLLILPGIQGRKDINFAKRALDAAKVGAREVEVKAAEEICRAILDLRNGKPVNKAALDSIHSSLFAAVSAELQGKTFETTPDPAAREARRLKRQRMIQESHGRRRVEQSAPVELPEEYVNTVKQGIAEIQNENPFITEEEYQAIENILLKNVSDSASSIMRPLNTTSFLVEPEMNLEMQTAGFLSSVLNYVRGQGVEIPAAEIARLQSLFSNKKAKNRIAGQRGEIQTQVPAAVEVQVDEEGSDLLLPPQRPAPAPVKRQVQMPDPRNLGRIRNIPKGTGGPRNTVADILREAVRSEQSRSGQNEVTPNDPFADLPEFVQENTKPETAEVEEKLTTPADITESRIVDVLKNDQLFEFLKQFTHAKYDETQSEILTAVNDVLQRLIGRAFEQNRPEVVRDIHRQMKLVADMYSGTSSINTDTERLMGHMHDKAADIYLDPDLDLTDAARWIPDMDAVMVDKSLDNEMREGDFAGLIAQAFVNRYVAETTLDRLYDALQYDSAREVIDEVLQREPKRKPEPEDKNEFDDLFNWDTEETQLTTEQQLLQDAENRLSGLGIEVGRQFAINEKRYMLRSLSPADTPEGKVVYVRYAEMLTDEDGEQYPSNEVMRKRVDDFAAPLERAQKAEAIRAMRAAQNEMQERLKREAQVKREKMARFEEAIDKRATPPREETLGNPAKILRAEMMPNTKLENAALLRAQTELEQLGYHEGDLLALERNGKSYETVIQRVTAILDVNTGLYVPGVELRIIAVNAEAKSGNMRVPLSEVEATSNEDTIGEYIDAPRRPEVDTEAATEVMETQSEQNAELIREREMAEANTEPIVSRIDADAPTEDLEVPEATNSEKADSVREAFDKAINYRSEPPRTLPEEDDQQAAK